MKQVIIGWYHSRFGRLDDDLETLITKAVQGALVDAEIEAKDIDAVYLGFYNSGFSLQNFASSLVFQAHDDLRFTPVIRVENACSTGSCAVHMARKELMSKLSKRVLVVGVEKMTDNSTQEAGANLLRSTYMKEESGFQAGAAGGFAYIAEKYFAKYGDHSKAMAKIAVKNHINGCKNPLAQMHKEFTFDFCQNTSEKNPYVVGPLRRTDCSLISDGAVALVMTDEDTAKSAKRGVSFRAAQHVNDFLPMSRRNIIDFEGPALAWKKALQEAQITLDDLSCIETHDCFTIAELIQYEAMGLTIKGQGYKALEEGWVYPNGKLPINLSGGLKSKGHPIGATGVSMHVINAMQLTEEAGEIQVKNPKIAGLFNMGGTAVANFVSILERYK